MKKLLIALFLVVPTLAFAGHAGGDLVGDLFGGKDVKPYNPYPPCYVTWGGTPNTLMQVGQSDCGGFFGSTSAKADAKDRAQR